MKSAGFISALVLLGTSALVGQRPEVAAASIVRLESPDIGMVGSGVLVGIRDNTAFFVTAKHVVVAGNTRAEFVRIVNVVGGRRRVATGSVVAEADVDLAVVAVPDTTGLFPSPLPRVVVDEPNNIPVGAELFALGCPEATCLHLPEPVRVRTQQRDSALHVASRFIVEGHSGGLIVTQYGGRVGLISQTLANGYRLVFDWKLVRKFLADSGYDVSLEPQRVTWEGSFFVGAFTSALPLGARDLDGTRLIPTVGGELFFRLPRFLEIGAGGWRHSFGDPATTASNGWLVTGRVSWNLERPGSWIPGNPMNELHVGVQASVVMDGERISSFHPNSVVYDPATGDEIGRVPTRVREEDVFGLQLVGGYRAYLSRRVMLEARVWIGDLRLGVDDEPVDEVWTNFSIGAYVGVPPLVRRP